MNNYKTLSQLEHTGSYLVRLLSAILHEQEVSPLPDGLTWEDIYQLAKNHSVEAMAFYGAQNFIKTNTQLYTAWKRKKDANIAQSLLQSEACNEIFHSFHLANIRFLPLKGYNLKQLYKQPEFRQMSDIDILIDLQDSLQVKVIMEHLKYEPHLDSPSYHDEYLKPPWIMIEIHKHLLPVDDPRYSYYQNIWAKASQDPQIPGCWKISYEDFYIFMIVHLEKHYRWNGSGIRSVMDIYVYLNQFKKTMNWTYIKNELQQLGLYDFSVKIESLSDYWFSDTCFRNEVPDMENELKEMQLNIFLSGVYGSKEFKKLETMNNIHIEHGTLPKIKYILKRMFMNKKALAHSYPLLNKYPFLLPFFWLHRFGHAIFLKQSAIRRELELFKMKSHRK